MATYKSIGQAVKTIEREAKKTVSKKKSLVASAINKELTAGRKEIVESLMTKTGLKRKVLNDRLAITRANPSSETIEGTITPIYGKRIYMEAYPFIKTVVRGGRKAIRLISPIYRKNMRTAFLSADGTRMYLRKQSSGGKGRQYESVRAVRGRSIPRLFDQFKIKDTYENKIIERVMRAVKSVLGSK